MDLTPQQRHALDVLAPPHELRSWTAPQLAERIGTSAHGAAATASSLVRHGLVRRINDRRGPVCYAATRTGQELAEHNRINAIRVRGWDA